jgi:4-amino-4-deoxy-L-arabinose transferase-like glycosyltransferase
MSNPTSPPANPFPARRSILLDLLLLLLVALCFELGGGAPFYHPDTLIEKALRTMAQAGDPKFFNYPALLLYLNGAVYQAWMGGADPAGAVDRYLSALHSGAAWAQSLFTPGQCITLFFSLLGVASTYLAALRLTHRRVAGLAAGLILCTCLLWATDAHYITVDTPLAGLGMAAVTLALFFTGQQRPLRLWQVVLLGILAGLTASAKYNGALVLLAIAAAAFPAYANRWQWFRRMLLLAAVSLGVFLLTNPYILLSPRQFLDGFTYEMNHARIGHLGFTTPNAALFHLQTSLPLAYAEWTLGLAAVGLLWLLLEKRIPLAHKLGFLIYPAAGYALIGSSHLAFQRYMLPFLPFIAILAALALLALVEIVSRQAPRFTLPARLLALALLLAVLLPNARNVLQADWLLTQTDTRDYFVRVMRASGLVNARGPGFAGQYTDLYFDFRFRGSQIEADRAHLLVIDSFSHDRWLYDASARLDLRRANYRAGYAVVQMTPYTRPKAEVPISPQSIYSPYLPDLYDRALPGPYIEIYLQDPALLNALMSACLQTAAPCAILPADQGYYYQSAMQD